MKGMVGRSPPNLVLPHSDLIAGFRMRTESFQESCRSSIANEAPMSLNHRSAANVTKPSPTQTVIWQFVFELGVEDALQKSGGSELDSPNHSAGRPWSKRSNL